MSSYYPSHSTSPEGSVLKELSQASFIQETKCYHKENKWACRGRGKQISETKPTHSEKLSLLQSIYRALTMAKVSCWAQSYGNNQDNILGLMGLAISGKPETVRSYVIVIIVNKSVWEPWVYRDLTWLEEWEEASLRTQRNQDLKDRGRKLVGSWGRELVMPGRWNSMFPQPWNGKKLLSALKKLQRKHRPVGAEHNKRAWDRQGWRGRALQPCCRFAIQS